MKIYSIKWNITLSIEYQELILNLFYQEYFGELWEQIQRHNFESSRIFVEEVNKLQYKVIRDYFDKKACNIR